ncbi:MAG TPA: response regulator [Methylomirabilota bacterium]|jgi:CheY-like chemotaxis protein|nr:response regulator [Methylomirabilota bacterium]
MSTLPDLAGLTVLVVEDDYDSREALTTFLEACGAHVVEASNGQGALAYIDANPAIKAVVTDLAMPHGDGVMFVKKVRAHPRRRSLPVIAITAFYERFADWPQAGFDAFFKKPIKFEELGEKIRSLVTRG